MLFDFEAFLLLLLVKDVVFFSDVRDGARFFSVLYVLSF